MKPEQTRPPRRRSLPAIHPDGRKFVVGGLAIAAVAAGAGWAPLAWMALILSLWIAALFRDPERFVPIGVGIIVAPVDGFVEAVDRVEPPGDLADDSGPPPGATRIVIAQSLADAHIARAPASGFIRRIVRVAGEGVNALIVGDDGSRVALVAVPGQALQRTLLETAEGDRVDAGQRIGLVGFGGRIAVYLPAPIGARVAVGQRTVAGETIIGLAGDPLALIAVMR